MVAMALGYGSKNADNAAKGAKHTDDAADATEGADGAIPSGKGGGGGTPPGKGGGGDDPVKKSQEAHERARTAKIELPAGNEQITTSSDHIKTSATEARIVPTDFRNLM